MKRILLFAMLILSVSVFATNSNPGKMKANKAVIEQQLADLDKIEKIIAEEGLTYSELAIKYPELVSNVNLSPASSEDGIFEGASDSPLGIPGFWWGFCLGWVGMLIVYLTMDEGSTRKEQVMNALWGCIIAYVLFFGLYVLILGNAFLGLGG